MKKILIGALVGIVLLGALLYGFAGTLFMVFLNKVEVTELVLEGNTVVMGSLINSKTPEQFEKIFEINPKIDTLVMKMVEGSIDDEANLKLAKWINKKDLTFILQADSEIASGGTDFFLAGKKRIIHKGAKIGVHSWSGITKTATDFPVGDVLHQPYIEYYMSLGWNKKQAEDFYYFTINAAASDDIYWMNEEEIVKYNLNTEALK